MERDSWIERFSQDPNEIQASNDKVTLVYVAMGYDIEARQQGVREIWDEGGDDDLFREHMKSLEKRKW